MKGDFKSFKLANLGVEAAVEDREVEEGEGGGLHGGGGGRGGGGGECGGGRQIKAEVEVGCTFTMKGM